MHDSTPYRLTRREKRTADSGNHAPTALKSHIMAVMKKPLLIAIDGPAGAGKSTVAQKLAQLLGLAYLDSGATYRAAALKVLESGISPDDEHSVTALIEATDIGLATDN